MMRDKKGFTLVELIIVIIIIGILAAIAAPAMKGNLNKAKKSEAVAAMGAIRAAERLHRVEFGHFVAVTNFSTVGSTTLNRFITAEDLNGTWFSSHCYRAQEAEDTDPGPTILTLPTLSQAPKKDEAKKFGTITMLRTGAINYAADPP